jgi:Family of unknown function (DUF6459)
MPPTISIHPLPGAEPPHPTHHPDQLTFALPGQRAGTPPAIEEAAGPGTLEQAAAGAGATAVLRLVIEVIDGRRPAAHLERSMSPAVLSYLAAALSAGLRARRPGPRDRARLCSVHLQLPRSGIAEVSAVWQHAGRIAALAAAFEQADDARPLGWRCTYLRLG